MNIIKLRKDDLVAVMIGHIHIGYTWRRVNKDNIQIIILPSPTVNPDGVFALLRYHKTKNELIVSDVNTNYDGAFDVQDVKLDESKNGDGEDT
jgi:hypothetical protein